jgi:two-component system, OmpR family, copper resistance phosphate regulon response regulator CusR
VRILIVEDEPAIARAVSDALVRDGYAVDAVGDGQDALTWVGSYDYDLVVVDLVLPGLDGISLVRELRRTGLRVPVLILTSLDAVSDRVRGLDAGADDYLAKPFAMDELLARIRALRRRQAGEPDPVIRVGDLELDPARRRVTVAGREVRLTTREFALLEVLARHPGQVFAQDRLIEAVWNADFSAESNVVEVHVRSIRRKLDAGRAESVIETLRGAGYRVRVG